MTIIISTILAAVMASFVIIVRMKAAKRPVSGRKIILPPIFMSTGAFMYFSPVFRVTHSEILETVIAGLLFSILLIKTSTFEIRDNEIYLKRSKAFIFILVGLLIIRIAAKVILSSTIEVGQLSGMFFLLAFSMILPWRVAMYMQYKKFREKLAGNLPPKTAH
ncbi:cytochrome c biogenesis protein CcdC [Bacillus kribbensis]|uniref:CcdC family protein n=1 Tax=Peribacillus kribbensis TaxID=356658 RepID=UPI0003FFC010